MTISQAQIHDKTQLFLQEASVIDQDGSSSKSVMQFFMQADSQKKHVLYKNTTLHFVVGDEVVNVDKVSTAADNASNDYIRFDGERITRIDPEYYLGPAAEPPRHGYAAGSANASGLPYVEFSSNNNNNNNNNNGNNNG